MRPTFYHMGQPVRAAGILLWSITPYNVKVHLFRQVGGGFEDIGGKTDSVDTSAMDTAIRETCEETNNHLFSNTDTYEDCATHLQLLLSKCTDRRYNCKSKYLLFYVYVNPSILQLSMKRFGFSERTEWGTLSHRYMWCAVKPYPLHWRLCGLV